MQCCVISYTQYRFHCTFSHFSRRCGALEEGNSADVTIDESLCEILAQNYVKEGMTTKNTITSDCFHYQTSFQLYLGVTKKTQSLHNSQQWLHRFKSRKSIVQN